MPISPKTIHSRGLVFDHEIHSVTIMMKAMMQNIYIFKHFMSDMAYLTDAKA